MLMASLNIDRCREATVQLAARDLADAAVVVAPAVRGRRMPMSYGDASGAVEQRMVDEDPASVAGLSEALRGFPPSRHAGSTPQRCPTGSSRRVSPDRSVR